MDIVDYAEMFYGVQLADWQKEHIRTLNEAGKNAKVCIVMPRHHGRDQAIYFYLNHKELMPNGSKNDNQH